MRELVIENAWETKDFSSEELRVAVNEVMELLDQGKLRVAEKINSEWSANHYIKKAILIYMRISENKVINGTFNNWFDKVDQKNWNEEDFNRLKIRAVPGCIVRKSAYIAENVVLMPSFVNVGAFVDSGTMVDTWATIGSCAQIGKNCHISGGVGIGGVLEPVQNNPVIIEDDCFIGARSEISEGVIVGRGSVIAMGCYISASTKIINRSTSEISYGYIPPYSVVVPGNVKTNDSLSMYCVIIVKTVDEKTRSKTQINDLLRFYDTAIAKSL